MLRILFILFLLPIYCFGQFVSTPLSLYQQFNGSFDYTIIGKSHNPYDNWVFPPQPCTMVTSSSATLSLAANQTIVGAYLVWSGISSMMLNWRLVA